MSVDGKKPSSDLAKRIAGLSDEEQRTRKGTTLELLRKGETITKVAMVLNIRVTTLYAMKKKDPAFAKAWDQAVEDTMEIRRERSRKRTHRNVPSKLPKVDWSIGSKFGDPKYRQNIIANLSKGWTITKAIREAGVSYPSFKNWRRQSAEFEEQVQIALQAGVDVLEDEARRRAVDGVKRPVYAGGNLVGEIVEYSDSLLAFLLRSKRYNEINVNARHSGTVNHVHSIDMSKLSDEELQTLERILAKAQITLSPEEYSSIANEDVEDAEIIEDDEHGPTLDDDGNSATGGDDEGG